MFNFFKNEKFMLYHLITIFLFLFTSILSAEIYEIGPSKNSQEELQELMILVNPGDTIILKEGVYELTDGLSLTHSNVTIKGEGMHKSILDFSKQISGAQGLLVSSDQVVLKDFAVIDSKGDGIKVVGADGIYIVNVRTQWRGEPKTSNGAYGFYPVQSKNVYIEGCIAIGASDAGIYVGQSENIIVRNNIAEYNVAGIEIENSYYADVYENIVRFNTGGILVFDLPDLPQQGGHSIRVFDNKSIKNNTTNFAPKGNIVSTVPRGTGILVLASKNVEIFENEIRDNATINLAIVSYFEETDDVNYYPHPRTISLYKNDFSNSGFDPDINSNEMAKILSEIAGEKMPDIFWDGILPLKQIFFGQREDERIFAKDNGNASYLSINPIKYFLPFIDPANRDLGEFDQMPLPLKAVEINIPLERIN